MPSTPPAAASAQERPRDRLRELARLFLRLGATAFGGPAAHVAMMEDEVVRRRAWLTRGEFLDLLGATNLIPGPNSTELAIHVGHRRAGWPGLLVAGTCFILPAFVMVAAIAWAYVRFGTLPALAGVLYGVKPVVIAVVVQALWGLGHAAVKSAWHLLLGVLVLAGALAGAHELALLLAAGLVAAAASALVRRRGAVAPALVPAWTPAALAGALQPAARDTLAAGAAVGGGVAAGAAAAATAFGLWPLFLFFARTGAVLFGSGYVLLAFLRGGLVERTGWLTEAQLLDAVAVGQVTPGPVFTTATFIGYVLGGAPGAVVATVGIFLPAFVFVALSGPLVPRIRRSAVAGAVLDGVNVASLALMAAVTLELARGALVDGLAVALLALAALLLLRWRVNSAWLVAGGAAVGLAAGWWRG